MVRLHLVGFTTDLKNLIFADERGATSGKYVVSVDSRLRHTLDEVARLEEDDYDSLADQQEAVQEEEPAAPPAPKVVSKLTPKEIQSLLRQGKTEQQVARLAGTDVDWVRRFSFAILAERQDVIDAVRKATLSKPRLGASAMSIGDAVEENLGAKRLRMGPEAIEEAWKAMRKNGRWQVSFEYESRGQKRLARYSYDPNTRQVEPLNDIALELGWRADARGKPAPAKPAAGPPKIVSGVRQPAGRAAAKVAPPRPSRPAAPRPAPAEKPASAATRAAAGRNTPTERPISAGTRPVAKPSPASRRTTAERPDEAVPEDAESPRRRTAPSIPEDAGPASGPAEGVQGRPRDDDTGDEFIIQRPRNPEKREYGSLPTVWRPSRRN